MEIEANIWGNGNCLIVYIATREEIFFERDRRGKGRKRASFFGTGLPCEKSRNYPFFSSAFFCFCFIHVVYTPFLKPSRVLCCCTYVLRDRFGLPCVYR